LHLLMSSLVIGKEPGCRLPFTLMKMGAGMTKARGCNGHSRPRLHGGKLQRESRLRENAIYYRSE